MINLKQGHKSSLLTLVDRKNRYGHVIKVDSKRMHHINEKLLELINKEQIKIKTITKDNRSEFNTLTKITKNFNGLIRRTFPKGTNFDKIEEIEIQNIVNKINKMLRKIFGYLSSKNFTKHSFNR